ncbi:hypothetical protein STENM327S_02477 [Streptomyces tendae]
MNKTYGSFTAVHPLDLTVPQGSFFALLGASGCGKTTTLRMIAGLEEPSGGTVHLGDQDVTAPPPYKRPVNTVFQSYALFPHLDIYENVAFGLRRRGIKSVKKQVGEMLDLVQLGEQARTRRDLYAKPSTVFRKVTFPLSMPGVVSGTLLTFIPATGDYVNASLLGSADTGMIGNVIQSQFLRVLDYPTAAALSFVLMAAILAMVTFYIRKSGTEDLV